MNSMARSLALRALHRREVRDRLQWPAAVGNKNKQTAAAAAAAYSSTADRLAAYRYRTDSGCLLVPLVAFGTGTWLIATAATRYLMTPPRQGTTTKTAAATTVVEGPRSSEVAASPTN